MSKAANFIKNIVGITGNLTSHNGRYINLDGTPYGSCGLARFFLSPTVALNFAMNGIYEVASVLSGTATPTEAASMMAMAAPLIGMVHALQLARPSSKRLSRIVIDRRGDIGDVRATWLAQQELGKRMIGSVVALPVAVGITVSAGVQVYPAIAYYAMEGIFSARAKSKIRQNKWSVMSEPPPPREWKKAAKEQRSGKLQPAFG